MKDDKHFIEEIMECSRAEPDMAKRRELNRQATDLNFLVENFYVHRTTSALKRLVGEWTKSWLFMDNYNKGEPQPPLAGTPDVVEAIEDEQELRVA